MKKIKIIAITVLSLLSYTNIFAHTIHWTNLENEEKHILNVNAGWEYSFVYGIGYGYKLETKIPIIIEASYTIPSGETILDDFKTKIGGQINVYQINNFHFNASI